MDRNQSFPRKHYLPLSLSHTNATTPCFLQLYLFINISLYSCILSACFLLPGLCRLIITSLKEIPLFERLVTHLIGILSIHYFEPQRGKEEEEGKEILAGREKFLVPTRMALFAQSGHLEAVSLFLFPLPPFNSFHFILLT